MSNTSLSSHLLLLLCLCCISLNFHLSTAADSISWGRSLSGNNTIVSKKGMFELGFFSPGTSYKYYIGIWYKNRPEKTVVWVANRDTPVTNPSLSEFKIHQDGNLVLLNQFKIQIWSTNLSSSVASNFTVGVLNDTGNLVLTNMSDSMSIYWQSFDHPTDTWLPGGRIGWNKLTNEYRTLTSWISPEDPAPGLYSYGMDTRGINQLVQLWNGSEMYWISGEWNGHSFTLVPEMTRKDPFRYEFVESERYITYSITDTNFITRFVADASGKGLQWAWLNDSIDWLVIWSQPRLQCDVYSLCGSFSICDDNGFPTCQCLQGYKAASPEAWSSNYWNGGCIRKFKLSCSNNESIDGERDKFTMINSTQIPENAESVAAQNSKDCELACLSDCSCTAYAYSDGECSVWKGSLQNLRRPSDGYQMTSVLYLRLAASELPDSKSSRKRTIGVIVGAVGGFLVLLGIVFAVIRRYCNGRETGECKAADGSALTLIRYKDLKKFTTNFSERLGGGGFGSVFKGTLPDSTAIAVKKLEGFRQGEKQFRTEVSTMGIIQHVNLVRLRGFCCEGSKRLLVYEYMPNGSLDSCLFQHNSNMLNWRIRYQIALGIAKGLEYLHDKCRDCIIHCDIKPENILLDENFRPKLADFGMAKLKGRDFSRVLTTMRGTAGYLAPEWISGLPITPKADVYSFGMVLFELISGRRNNRQYNDEKVSFFPIWAAERVNDGEVLCLLDEKLEGCAGQEELTRICRVACWCIQDGESHRPSMAQVVQMLEGVVEVSIPPIPSALQQLVKDQNI